MQLKKLLFTFLAVGLLAGCSNRYGELEKKMDDCGYGVASYPKFHSCMKESIVIPDDGKPIDYYNQTAADVLEFIDVQGEKVKKKKITPKAAYKNIAAYCNQKSAQEQQQNHTAQMIGAAILVAAAASTCANTNCLGNGGGGYYNTPLLCSQNPNGSPQCNMGKACGNTCIPVTNVCHVGAGTACNLSPKPYP
jgi:hypothetical protein